MKIAIANITTKKITLKSIPSLLIFLFLFSSLSAEINPKYFDGPYIFNHEDSLHLRWIERGIGIDTMIAKKDAGIFERDSLPIVDLQNLDFDLDEETTYDTINKVIAVSDVHGQHDLMVRLLQIHGVIDEQRHWTYGDGHLMIVGDNFDRGDQVLDILWFLFYLEKEAAAAGGKVHILLGNHEIMVLNGDLRYTHKKYRYTSAFFTTPYDQFFQKGSVLGDWVASHKVMTVINQRLFVHAGLSPSMLRQGWSMKEVNEIFREQIVRQPEDSILVDEELSLLYSEDGPVWYRGYFDSLQFNEDSIDYILKELDLKTIIIGHTSFPEITSLFGGKVIVIDCSIKLGKDAHMIIMEKEELYIGDLEGERAKLDPAGNKKKQSLFDYIYSLDATPRLRIETDVGRLIRKKSSEEYQSCGIVLLDKSERELLNLPARVRARGNMRKKVCRMPPLKIDFKKSLLDSIGFHKRDKLKLVLPCNARNSNQQEMLYKEFFIYELYGLIDKNCLRTKLIDVTLGNDDKKSYHFTGFLIEDDKEYARRKNARILDKASIISSKLDRESFVKMEFFQYMISNTDWSLRNKHNLTLVKLPDMERATVIAYDFDYSGFVGQAYAVPHTSLPIETVHDRYFFSYPVSKEEFYQMVDYFLSIEDDVYELCDKATYMKTKTIKANKHYLKEFFDLLRKPRRLKKEMVKKTKKKIDD